MGGGGAFHFGYPGVADQLMAALMVKMVLNPQMVSPQGCIKNVLYRLNSSVNAEQYMYLGSV